MAGPDGLDGMNRVEMQEVMIKEREEDLILSGLGTALSGGRELKAVVRV